MADTLGASAFIYCPGYLEQFFAMSDGRRLQMASQTSADNAATSIIIEPASDTTLTGTVLIVAIHATYEAIADTGDIDITVEVSGKQGPGTLDAFYTIKAAAVTIYQSPVLLQYGHDAGDITVLLDAGGSGPGTLTVWYVPAL